MAYGGHSLRARQVQPVVLWCCGCCGTPKLQHIEPADRFARQFGDPGNDEDSSHNKCWGAADVNSLLDKPDISAAFCVYSNQQTTGQRVDRQAEIVVGVEQTRPCDRRSCN